MKQNLGKLDRIFRFVLALWLLGPYGPHILTNWLQWIVILIAWIALIESFTGYCILHDKFGIDNKNQ
jgi:hypothetical protein